MNYKVRTILFALGGLLIISTIGPLMSNWESYQYCNKHLSPQKVARESSMCNMIYRYHPLTVP